MIAWLLPIHAKSEQNHMSPSRQKELMAGMVYYNILRWQRDPKTAVVDRLLKESSKRHYEYPLGAFLCHATNKNTNGIVIAAVAMSTGWNAVGLISRPARCIKGIGNTVNSQ